MTDEGQSGWGAQPDPTTQMGPYGAPQPPKKRSPLPFVLIPIGACMGLVVLLVIIGAIVGTTEEDEPTAQALVSTTEDPTTTTEAPTTTAATTTEAPTTATAPPTTAPPTTAPPTTPPAVLMPDVVCMNLQVAQDTIQEAGVFFSRSEDATGQERLQVLDSNWVVVAQTPAPGSAIGEGDAVLSVVKLDEPNDC